MTITRRETLALFGAGTTLAVAGGFAAPSFAQDAAPVIHEIQMLNKATNDPKTIMVFEPDLVRAKIGDTIKLIPTDKSHSANSMKGLIPEGAEPFKSAINEAVEYVVAVDGAYAIQCTPHMAMGMVMLVLVGEVSSNFDTVKAGKFKGKAKDRFADIFLRADAMLAEEAASG